MKTRYKNTELQRDKVTKRLREAFEFFYNLLIEPCLIFVSI